MKTTRIVALAVAATLGLGSVSAFAQGRHDGHRNWQHQRADRGHWDNHRFNGHRRDGGDIAGALVLGGLVGALVGSASNNYSYAAPPATYYAPPATYYAPPPATYYAPPATYYNPGYGYYGY